MGGGSTADDADYATAKRNRQEDKAKRDKEARKRRIAARERAKASKPKKVERVPK